MRALLNYYGAKLRIAGEITPYFPPHATYAEPFGGAAGVLLSKVPAQHEIYNDLDGRLVRFLRVFRDACIRG